jgi:hypothetical protein
MSRGSRGKTTKKITIKYIYKYDEINDSILFSSQIGKRWFNRVENFWFPKLDGTEVRLAVPLSNTTPAYESTQGDASNLNNVFYECPSCLYGATMHRDFDVNTDNYKDLMKYLQLSKDTSYIMRANCVHIPTQILAAPPLNVRIVHR